MFSFKKLKIFILLFSIITVSITISFYIALKPKKTLPVIQPNEVAKELVEKKLWNTKKYHIIKDFKLKNQNGQLVTLSSFEGKVLIVNFFFTSCRDICPKMINHISSLQKKFKYNPNVMFLSHTVMPEVDSVSVLKSYAEKNNIESSKWNLLTGSKQELYKLARESYLVSKKTNSNTLIHTENIVLVDKKRRIRGFYNGTDSDSIEQLSKDVLILLN